MIRARMVVGVATIAALAATAVTGVMLARWYVPNAVATGFVRPDGADRSQVIVTLHGISLLVSLVLSLPWAVISSVAARRHGARLVVAVVAGAAVVVATVVAVASWRLVRWDQLGLWSISVGSDFSGLWAAAFSDDVRFLLIDGSEVSQSTYATSVVVQLAAPVLALAAVVVGWASSRASDLEEPGAISGE